MRHCLASFEPRSSSFPHLSAVYLPGVIVPPARSSVAPSSSLGGSHERQTPPHHRHLRLLACLRHLRKNLSSPGLRRACSRLSSRQNSAHRRRHRLGLCHRRRKNRRVYVSHGTHVVVL